MKIEVTNIDYDTDGLKVDLPNTLIIEIPKDIKDIDDIDQYLSDQISNITGYCHKGFDADIK